MEILTFEGIMLIGSVLLIAGVLIGKSSYRVGLPLLLIFLLVGMGFGTDGVGIQFSDMHTAQFIGMIALCVILFSGGMGTKISAIRPVIAPGLVLSTVGVLLTALVTGLFIWFLSGLSWTNIHFAFMPSLLLAATMSSTDSASVFSILRSKKQGLRERLRPLLELESGSNDPMAYMLTMLMIGILSNSGAQTGIGTNLFFVLVQLVVGALSGYLIGRAAVWSINRIHLENHSLYSVLLLAFIFFSFAFTDLLRGNGYLAVYIAGLVVGNHRLTQKRTLTVFFDGFTWLMQIVMFLMLGLLVNTRDLIRPEVLLLGGLVGLFLIVLARPLAVLLCLAPFRKFSRKARFYVSWVGLRGAVPILFATYPLMARIEHADLLFNVVFLSTILSLVIQGTTVSGMANILGLAFEEREASFEVNMHEDITSALTEVEVNEALLATGRSLKDISLPENTLVMMICREGEYFVPQGKTELLLGDKLLVISDRSKELESTYREIGIDDVMKLR